jgi:VanZ family protein
MLGRVSRQRYWGAVVAYVVLLLTTQSVMGLGIDKFKELWGVDTLEVVAYLIVAAGASGVVWTGWKVWARCSAGDRAWIALALVLYGYGTFNARNPQERLHYLGYGLLAMLLYFGFARDRDAAAPGGEASALAPAAAALAIGSLIGLADESLQIIWPRRYFDWADVGMNLVAVGLGLLVAIPVWDALRREREDAR